MRSIVSALSLLALSGWTAQAFLWVHPSSSTCSPLLPVKSKFHFDDGSSLVKNGSGRSTIATPTPSRHHHRRRVGSSLFLASDSSSYSNTTPSTASTSNISWSALEGQRILVVGGSGRVGGSCVVQFLQRGAAHVYVGGTSLDRYVQARERWMRQQQQQQPKGTGPTGVSLEQQVDFVALNREDVDSVQSAMEALQAETGQSLDLVVHTAGPFQGKVSVPNGVLEACLRLDIPYMDVCDDYCTAKAAQTRLGPRARDASLPCIVSTGCWPGVSSLMARQMMDDIVQQQQPQPQEEEQSSSSSFVQSWNPSEWTVDFSFFTAGSGGAGLTLLVATFLILSEPALVIQSSNKNDSNQPPRRTSVPPMSDYDRVSFGSIVGDRNVAPLNLLETASIADHLQIGNVQSKFGTAPPFWNTLLGFMARSIPPAVLANEEWMRNLSIFSLPIVRLVDFFAGATNAMRCDVTWQTSTPNKEEKWHATAVYAHGNLEPCVGECVAAFGAALLTTPSVVPPGIWFPEQAIETRADVDAVLELASVGAHTYTTTLQVQRQGGDGSSSG